MYTSREGREEYDYEITKEIYDRLGSFSDDVENERSFIFHCHFFSGAYIIIYGDLPGRYGMDKDMMKINDDELENVSGGSWEETSQLRRLLHAGNSNALLEHFLEQRGIEAMFF